LSSSWKDWEGRVINEQYPLHRFLGSGEQSAAFLTGNATIKLVVAENAENELARWERAARLSHPNLIRLFHGGVCQPESDGLLYVVMEYGEESLAGVLRDRPLNAVEVREMLGPVLEALAYLHSEGLVHGHIKTANIIAVGEQVKLASDGASEPVEGRSAAGDVRDLGMVVVEALTQEAPRYAESKLVLPETLPAEFAGLARECLEPEPGRRPTVAEVAARLQGTTPAVRTQAIPEPEARPRRSVPVTAAALVLGLGVVVIGAGILRRSSAPAAKEPSKVVAEAPAKQPVPPVAESPTPGHVVHEVLPEVPRQARNTIRGTVKIRVRAAVDAAGHVASARLDFAGPSKYLAKLTLEAARRWEFRPPTAQGNNLPSEWMLHFELTRSGTSVRPAEVSR
jgi:TonB family protein